MEAARDVDRICYTWSLSDFFDQQIQGGLNYDEFRSNSV